MAQAKKKTATKTAKKASCSSCAKKSCKKGTQCKKSQKAQESNTFFVISMSVLAATLLFADLIMMAA